MKNNRLTNEDVIKLRMACERIKELASLENASFSIDSKVDEKTKQIISPYMTWFESVADGIEKILNGEDVPYYYFQ